MMPLNQRQALHCEGSQSTRCRCRCAGRSHGAARSKLPEFFERLPTTDPHHVPKRSRQLPLPRPVGAVA